MIPASTKPSDKRHDQPLATTIMSDREIVQRMIRAWKLWNQKGDSKATHHIIYNGAPRREW